MRRNTGRHSYTKEGPGRLSRLIKVVTISAIVSVLSGGMALADGPIADGDGVVPLADNDLAFGDVCAGSTTSRTVPVWIQRQGGGAQVYANGANVTVTSSVAAGNGTLSAVMGMPDSITLPHNWVELANGTRSSTINSTVTFTAPTTEGPVSRTVTYRGSGARNTGGTLERDDAMAVTANVVQCTPPNTAPSVPGAPGASASPNRGTFSLSWGASSDAEGNALTYTLQHKNSSPGASWSSVASGIDTNSYSLTSEGEGTWTYRVAASDGVLESDFSDESSPVVVDKSAPNVPTASASRASEYTDGDGNEWWKGFVTVSFAGNGDPSLADGSDGSGVKSVSASQMFNTTGPFTASGNAEDHAGNVSEVAARSGNVDATNPEISFSNCPSNVVLGSSHSVDWTASDVGSGLKGNSSGTKALDSSSIGSKSVTQTAWDYVGNTKSAECSYKVVYDFNGFFRPIDMGANVFNVAKAGSAIPVKFSLGGYQGMNVISSTLVKAVPCTSGAMLDPVENTVAASISGLSYDADSDQYNYVWKTTTSLAQSCRSLTVTFADETSQTAYFRFNK